MAEQLPLLAGYASASIQEQVASGPRAGHPVRRLRSAAAILDDQKPRCARLEGFSLHANVAVAPHARDQLEHLCRYLLRPPLTLERLTESSHGQLLYELPHPRRDGPTHILLDPQELIEKLSVLVPAPRLHLLRFHGVLAPHAAWRAQIIPHPTAAGSPATEADVTQKGPGAVADAPPPPAAGPGEAGAPSSAPGWTWAALMHRAFAIDVLACPNCGGRLRLIATLHDPVVILKLLAHLGMARSGPSPGPAPPVP